MTEEKRKRLTTAEAVRDALEITQKFIGQRIDDFKEEVHQDFERLEERVGTHATILREHEKQIATISTLVKSLSNPVSRLNGKLGKKEKIGGAATLIAAIIYGILQMAGVL